MLLQFQGYDPTKEKLTISVPLVREEKQKQIDMEKLVNYDSTSYSLNTTKKSASPVPSFDLQRKQSMMVNMHFKPVNDENIREIIAGIRAAFPAATTKGFMTFVAKAMEEVSPESINRPTRQPN